MLTFFHQRLCSHRQEIFRVVDNRLFVECLKCGKTSTGIDPTSDRARSAAAATVATVNPYRSTAFSQIED